MLKINGESSRAFYLWYLELGLNTVHILDELFPHHNPPRL